MNTGQIGVTNWLDRFELSADHFEDSWTGLSHQQTILRILEDQMFKYMS
jgi:hypothetical protein